MSTNLYSFMFCLSISETIEEENLFYIVSPKDIVVAKQRDQDDHISWLLEHEMFEVRGHTQGQSKIMIKF